MKYKIRFTPDARDDLEATKEYLSQFYPSTPKKFFTALRKRITQLKDFPYLCPAYEDDADYRKLTVGDYLVFYMVNEDIKYVEVHRIFHASRDIKQHLNSL